MCESTAKRYVHEYRHLIGKVATDLDDRWLYLCGVAAWQVDLLRRTAMKHYSRLWSRLLDADRWVEHVAQGLDCSTDAALQVR